MVATAYVFGFGLLTLLPVVLWLDGPPPVQLPPVVWLSLLIQGTVCTAMAYCLWNFGVRRLSAAHVGVYSNFEPVVGVLLGVLILKEALSLGSILGGALVIGAAIFMALTPAVQPIRHELAAAAPAKTAARLWPQRWLSVRRRSGLQTEMRASPLR